MDAASGKLLPAPDVEVGRQEFEVRGRTRVLHLGLCGPCQACTRLVVRGSLAWGRSSQGWQNCMHQMWSWGVGLKVDLLGPRCLHFCFWWRLCMRSADSKRLDPNPTP